MVAMVSPWAVQPFDGECPICSGKHSLTSDVFHRGQGVMRIGVFQNVKPEGAFFGNIFIINLSYLL